MKDIEYLAEKEIHVFGLQRSGQHAITMWIMGMLGDSVYRNHMGKDANHDALFKIKGGIFVHKKDNMGAIKKYRFDHLSRSKAYNGLILGTELVEPERFRRGFDKYYSRREQNIIKSMRRSRKLKGLSKQKYFVPVIRAPYNNIASALYWKGEKHPMKDPDFFIPRWKGFAKEALGYTNFLPATSVPIIYDKWFQSENYNQIQPQ